MQVPSRRALGSCHQGGFSVGAINACATKTRAIMACPIKAVAIKAVAVKGSSGPCHQGEGGYGCGFLKQVKGESTSLLAQILFMAVVAGRVVTGARGSGSVGASRRGQVWIALADDDVGYAVVL